MSPRAVRLRECGLASPQTCFNQVLNLRSISIQRELRDKHLKFDERVGHRNKAYKLMIDTEEAYSQGAPRETIKKKDDEYNETLDKLEEATKQRKKRVAWLTESLSFIKTALRNRTPEDSKHKNNI